MFEISQHDPMLEKWWRNVKNDKDPWGKLCKYLQAINNFIAGKTKINKFNPKCLFKRQFYELIQNYLVSETLGLNFMKILCL